MGWPVNEPPESLSKSSMMNKALRFRSYLEINVNFCACHLYMTLAI